MNHQLAPPSIDHLPHELLMEIFRLRVGEEIKRAEREYFPSKASAPWCVAVQVSGVCRTWRSIALELPELWTHFSTKLEPQTLLDMAARSKDRSITMYILPSSRSWYKPPPWLDFVTRRLETLAYRLNGETSFLTLARDWDMPVLDTLILRGSSSGPESAENQFSSIEALLDPFPQLNHLVMHDCWITEAPEDAGPFDITYLDVLSQGFGGLENILGVLRCMPYLFGIHLDTDDLGDAIPPPSTAPLVPPVTLNELQRLEIYNLRVDQCIYPLEHINAPQLAWQEYFGVTLDMHEVGHRPGREGDECVKTQLRSFLRVLGLTSDATTEKKPFHYALLILEEFDAGLYLWNDPTVTVRIPTHTHRFTSAIPIALRLQDWLAVEETCKGQALTVGILQNLEVSGLQVLHVVQRAPYAIRNAPTNATVLMQFSSAHPAITEIHLDNFSALRFMHLLRQKPRKDQPASPFPALRSVVFSKVKFGSKKILGPLWLQLEHVSTWLHSRLQVGLAINKVTFKGCSGITEETVVYMRGISPPVTTFDVADG